MAIELTSLVKKPLRVSGVQVTEENMEELATLCGGEIRIEKTGDTVKKYIKVPVWRPLNEKQTKAYVGHWILFSASKDTSCKVYTDKALWANFDAVQEELWTPEEKLLHDIFDAPRLDRPKVGGLIKGNLLK